MQGADAGMGTAMAVQLVFVDMPQNTTAGSTLSPAVTVAVEDSSGKVVTSSTASVTLTLATNPTDAMLAGTLTRVAIAGIATFDDLVIQTAGIGYVLGASSSSLTAATSGSFNIASGPATQLAFGVQPSNAVAGVAIAPAVTVTLTDAFGNAATDSSASVTVGLASQPSGVLHGTLVQSVVMGVATFDRPDCPSWPRRDTRSPR